MADRTPRADRLRRRHTGQRVGEEDSDDTDRPLTPTPSGSHASASSKPTTIPLPGDDVDETAELGGTESDSIASRDSSLSKRGSSQTTESADIDEKEGEEGDGEEGKKPLGRFSSMTQRIKSPLMSTLNLEELRESIEGKFAPLHIPPHRRWQTAAVATWALLLPLCLFVFLMLASYTSTWYALIPYLIWVQFDSAPNYGGRPKKWARGFFLWKYFAQYYPCSIVKEADLPSDRPYLFGYHPHGIIGMGAFANFATEGTGFSEQFPGITPHLLTLESNFKMPFYREILMFHGICSVSKPSCANILRKGAGSAITIVIGGAAESLSAHPGTADLTLKKRFGFIKMAIREGADLVPVFSFGENDIYDQLSNHKGSFVYSVQKKFQKIFGFTLPLFYGRGIFNYNLGLMPFRHPIVSVFGKPIHVEKDSKPSDEKVQEFHRLYIEELKSIWDKYKDVYAKHRTKELTLVE